MASIPVVAYHSISDNSDFGLNTVSPAKFERHMKLLQENSFNPITFQQLKFPTNIPEMPIIITFDDGYRSVYEHALPIMDTLNFTAVVFVITGFIGKENSWEPLSIQHGKKHLSREELIKLVQSGWELASHTHNHLYLPACSKNIIQNEIKLSKKIVEEISGRPIESICLPYGSSSKRVRISAEQIGFHFAARKISLFRRRRGIEIIRRSIYSTDTDKQFLTKVNHPFQFNSTMVQEWIIQLGALASIATQIPSTILSKG